jgi:hypothetical protein
LCDKSSAEAASADTVFVAPKRLRPGGRCVNSTLLDPQTLSENVYGNSSVSPPP